MAFEDGPHHFVETNSYPLIDQKGNIYAVVETIKDITEIKKLEDERDHLREQLIQLQKMEAIGNLAAGIVHDFDNILTGIIGYTKLALARVEGTNLEKDLNHVLEMANKAASLTRKILIMGKKAPMNKKPIDLNWFVSESLTSIRRMVEEHVLITTDYFKGTLLIEADDSQLYQVLLNLMINARDAMPEGGTVVIKTGVDKERGFVFFSVSDTGYGIPEKLKSRIFEPFFTTK